MFVIWRALDFRRKNIELFRGDYLPLTAEGLRQDNVCVFARVFEGRRLLAIAPRMTLSAWQQSAARGNDSAKESTPPWPLGRWWSETVLRLPAGALLQWQHVITGDAIESAKPAKQRRGEWTAT